jgi:hypothetical protein
MQTTRGEIPETDLRKQETSEPVPCGTCITTTFFASDGEMVRQDIKVVVDPDKVPGLAGLTKPSGA